MNSLSRRRLLQSLGLGAGALMLGPRFLRHAAAESSAPRRFVFVVEGNGFVPKVTLSPLAQERLDTELSSPIGEDRWWSRKYTHTEPLLIDTPDLDQAIALGALADQGLTERASVIYGLSSRIVGGGHSGRHGVLSSTRTVGGSPGGQTIDAYLAARLGAESPFDAVRLGVGSGGAVNLGTCAAARGDAIPLILNPQTAHGLLFGAAGAGRAGQAFADRRMMLDFAESDVMAALENLGALGPEREKLTRYQDAIMQLRNQHSRLESYVDQISAFAPPMPEAPQTDRALETLATQMRLATASLQAGLTQVAVVGSGTGGGFGLVAGSVHPFGRHDIKHTAPKDSAFVEIEHEIHRRQFETVAEMARTLADTPEPTGEGSMLDNTLIVWIGDNGEQHHSTASEFPVVLIGGESLGLTSAGKTIVYPGLDEANHHQLSNLWNTVGHLAGQDLNEFGGEGPSRRHAGPLAELLG